MVEKGKLRTVSSLSFRRLILSLLTELELMLGFKPYRVRRALFCIQTGCHAYSVVVLDKVPDLTAVSQ